MKKHLLIVLLLLPFVCNAQSYVQFGPGFYPMSAWGAEMVGDFQVAHFTPEFSLGVGAMTFVNTYISDEEPNSGKRVTSAYLAPQIGLHYSFTSIFDCYLRGGAGLAAVKGNKITSRFLYNGVLGVGLSIWPHIGLYAEAGLPFSSLGLRFSL